MTEKYTMAKVRVNNQSNNDTLTGTAISVVSTDTRNQTAQARANSPMALVKSVVRMENGGTSGIQICD